MGQISREEILSIYERGAESVIELVESLSGQIARIERELQSLREQVGRNSRNSSKPPSSDGFKRVVHTRKASGKKRGGQPGHKGNHLPFALHPDTQIVHSPNCCPDCGESLAESPVIEEERRQIIDIPKPVASVVEHLAQTKECSHCRRRVKASFPENVRHRVEYGENISALVVYLSVEHAVSIDRIAEIIESFSGFRPSAGTLCSMIERCAELIKPAEAVIVEGIAQAPVANFDESGVRAQECKWLHSASTETLTHYAVHPRRGNEAMDAINILPRFQGVAVHDFLKAYLRYECQHSFCNAHLLRELQWFSEERKHPWADKISETLLLLRRLSLEETRAEEEIDKARQRYDVLVEKALEQHPPNILIGKKRVAQSKEHNFLERLRKYKDDILRFLYDPRVPFTNNLAERDIRPIKTKLKVSGCFRSDNGAEAYCRIRSYCSTAKKQLYGVWNALRDAFDAKPFIPNIEFA